MGQTGATVLSLDPKSNPRVVREKCGPDIVLLGGIDVATTLFLHGPDEIKKEAETSHCRWHPDPGAGLCGGAGYDLRRTFKAMLDVAKAH